MTKARQLIEGKKRLEKYKNYSNTSLQRKFKSANSQRLSDVQWTNTSELSEKINEIEKLWSCLLEVYSKNADRLADELMRFLKEVCR